MPLPFEERIPFSLNGATSFLLGKTDYLSEGEREQLSEALYAAAAWHAGERRKSGQLYLMHPLQVAAICASLHSGIDVLVAALFHDVLENTPVTPGELEQRFGGSVRQLVEALTKHPAYSHRQYAEKVYARAKDNVEVAVIKVADACVNLMRHNQLLFTPEKHLEHLQEAREFYQEWLTTIPDFPSELRKMLARNIHQSTLDYENRLDPNYDTYPITPRYTRYTPQ